MPIINRRKSKPAPAPEPKPVEPVVEEPVAIAPVAPIAAPPPATPGKRSYGKPLAFCLAALALGVAVPFLVYMARQGFEGVVAEADASEPEVATRSSQDVELDLQRLQKIAGMAVLIQREYDLNSVTREEAEQRAEPTTLAALDGILVKNRRDLEEAQENMAQVLVQIHAAYENSPQQVERQFEAAIANAEAKQAPDIARALKVSFEALQASPDDASAESHFKQAITENL